MFFKPPIKLISILFPIIIFSLIWGCDQSQKEVDEYLDEFEEIVEKWESKLKSGQISALDLEEFEKDGARIETRGEELEAEPSAVQQDRAEQLTERLAVVIEGMMAKMAADRAESFLSRLGLDALLNDDDRAANDLPQRIASEVDGAEMTLIPSGAFEMGDSKNEPDEWMGDAEPVHLVILDSFYMDVYEVTNAQYGKFIRAKGHPKPAYWDDERFNQPNQPLVGVSWNDAAAYAEWAGKRLPTEAEWEYAARGDLKRKRYLWGDEEPDVSQCNFADKSVDEFLRAENPDWGWADMSVDDGYEFTAPVGSYPANGYGLYEMAGNVYEWCSDWYDGNYYSVSPTKNPSGPSTGEDGIEMRVVRGGSWYDGRSRLRAAYRLNNEPANRWFDVGFRCVSESP